MTTFSISVIALTDESKENDFFIFDGTRYGFKSGPKGGTAVVNDFATSNGLTDAVALALIEGRMGVTIQNNPAYADVKTDDGANGDTTADDGVNEGTRYNWVENGQLYDGTIIV